MRSISLEPVQNLAKLRRKSLIFENRSTAYFGVCEQRIAKNQRVMSRLVEILNRLLIKLFCLLLLTSVLYPMQAFSKETSESKMGAFEILSPTLTEKSKKREASKRGLEEIREMLREMRTKRKSAPPKDDFDRPGAPGEPDKPDLTSNINKDDKKREHELSTQKARSERIKILFENATYENFTPQEIIETFDEEILDR